MECIYIDDASCSDQEFNISQDADNVTDPLDIRNESSYEHNTELQVAHNEFQNKDSAEFQGACCEPQDSSRELQVAYITEFLNSSSEFQTVQCNAEFQDSRTSEFQYSGCELQTIDNAELHDSSSELQIVHSKELQVYNDIIFDPTPINMEDVITRIPLDKLNDDYVVCFIPDEQNHTPVSNQKPCETKTVQSKTPLVTVTKTRTNKHKKDSLDDNIAKKSKISEVKPYQCALCKQNFKIQSSLDLHRSWCERVEEIELKQKKLKMQNVNDKDLKSTKSGLKKGKNSCMKCKLEFSCKTSLLLHIKMNHWTELPCTHCDSIFPTGLALHEHLKLHLICFVCMVEYPNENSYSTHIADHESGNVYRYKCTSCNQLFRCVSQLEKHQKMQHRFTKMSITSDIAKKTRKYIPLETYYTEEQLEIMGMKQCEYCWKLVKPVEIMEHYQCYHHLRKCDICNCFLKYDKHDKHWHRNMTEVCKYCGSINFIDGHEYYNLQNFMKNVISLESITKFECRFCFLYDLDKEELFLHEKNCDQRKEIVKKVAPVIPENATKCVKCNQYKIDSESDIHSTIYNVGDLELPCIICAERHSCLKLIDHLYSHFYCGTCEKRFLKFYNQHYLSHKMNEIRIGYCPICRHKFVDISNHMKGVHPNAKLDWNESETQVLPTMSTAALERMVKNKETIPCVYCLKAFDTVCSFELHLKFKHYIHKCSQCHRFSFDSDCQECQKKAEVCIVFID